MPQVKNIIIFIIISFALSLNVSAKPYGILFHRAKNEPEAKSYIDKMDPIIAAGTHIQKISDYQYWVVYGEMDTEEEAKSVLDEFKNRKLFKWVELVTLEQKQTEDKSAGLPKSPAVNDQPKESVSYIENLVAMPEGVTMVNFSNRHINRIIAPGNRQIKDIIKEKGSGVEVQIEGRNAYISFLKSKIEGTNDILYHTTPVTIHPVVEPDIVYTLIVTPKPINAQTVELKLDKDHIEKNLTFFKGLSVEEKILKLVKSVRTDTIPESFVKRRIGVRLDIFKTIDVYYRKDVVAEGEGLVLKEYVIALKRDAGLAEIEINEKQFLVPDLTKTPLGISLEDFRLGKDNTRTRLFIVERT